MAARSLANGSQLKPYDSFPSRFNSYYFWLTNIIYMFKEYVYIYIYLSNIIFHQFSEHI